MKEGDGYYSFGADIANSDELRWNMCRHIELEEN